ncbi:MAG: hypothetical protein H0U39_03995 [Segetibacter sp.]|nr:hypothetical protein [Segetibacter sp.]
MKQAFENLLNNLKEFEQNVYEARAFSYLDIISWLESKVYEKPVYTIIREKYIAQSENKRFSGITQSADL